MNINFHSNIVVLNDAIKISVINVSKIITAVYNYSLRCIIIIYHIIMASY